MRFLIVSICLTLLISCNSRQSEQTEETQNISDPGKMPDIGFHQLTRDEIPSFVKFTGDFYEGWRWKDTLGENILILSVIAPSVDKEKNEMGEESQSAELHVVNYVKKDNDYRVLWKLNDGEKACGFDITAEFLKNSFVVSDGDKDGIAETSFLYKLACRSDVSPAYMKFIMHEDTVKYSLRGNMWVKASEEDSFMVNENTVNLENLQKKTDEFDQLMQSYGRYESEKDFVNAPPGFLFLARRWWMKFVKESFE